MLRVIRLGFASLAFFAFALCAFAQDELRIFRARQEAAAQKLSDTVSDALAASRRIEKSDPTGALILLRNAMTAVKSSRDVTSEKQGTFITQLQRRMTEVDNIARAKSVAQDLRPYSEKPKTKAPTYDDPRPKKVASAYGDFRDGVGGSAQIHRQGQLTREKGFVEVLKGQEKAIDYPTEDRPILFGSRENWERVTARGKVKLTEKEAKLLKALNSYMSVGFERDKFGLVINALQEKTGIIMMFDPASVEDVKLDYEDEVNFKVPGKLEVRTILKKILGDKGLTYVIKEGALQVMTPKKAREMVVVRSYPVGDLIQPKGAQLNPFFARQQMLQNVQQLIGLIQTTVDPSYWEPNGPGRIAFYEPSQSLIITGSAEMHYQLGGMSLFGR